MIKLFEQFSKESEHGSWWYLDNRPHKKPTVVYRHNGRTYQWWHENGQKEREEWHQNGKKHREDGPAVQYWYENGQKEREVWYLNGKRHREDGPAVKGWYENGQKEIEVWYLNDKKYSREEWIEKLKEIGSEHYEEQKMLYDAEKYNL